MDSEETAGRYYALHEAELAAMHLRACGIKAKVDNNVVASMNPLWGIALGGIRVQVPARDADEARELLQALYAPDPATEAVAKPEPAERDDLARRAWAASIMAFITLPVVVHLYSLLLLSQIARAPGKLSAKGRRQARLAALVDVVSIGAVIALTALDA